MSEYAPKTYLFKPGPGWLWNTFFSDDWIIAVIVWMGAFPILIPYFLLKWIYKGIYMPLDVNKRIEGETRFREQTAQDEVDARKKRLAEAPPVDRMTARLHTNGTAVEIYLSISETERAVMIENRLDLFVFEERPKFTPEQVKRHKTGLENDIAREQHPGVKEMYRGMLSAASNMAGEKIQIRLLDYLEYPYKREFETPYEAKQYADHFKTDILPKIRKLLDDHQTHQQSETIRL